MFPRGNAGQWRTPDHVRVLVIPDADRAEVERRPVEGVPARVVERVRIVLLAADGLTGAQIAERAAAPSRR